MPRKFAKRMLRRMRYLRMTQTQLSKATKITEASISQYANGIRLPYIPHVVKIARALHVSLDWLILGDPDSLPDWKQNS